MHDGVSAFDTAVAAVRAGAAPAEQARALYDQLTPEERLWLLDGDTPFWAGMAEMMQRYNAHPYVHGEVARLGVPGTRFVDGPRGCVSGAGTAFPVSMARGATWDTALEERVGEAIGREVRAQGGNFFGGVCINLPRHPAWGRVQETYGDEPHHLGEFGAALTRGTQRYVMACAKHYALNSMENARFHVDVTVDDATLHEVYLPHFKRTVDEGVAAIMSAYNSVNGEWVGQNPELLTGVLREQWGFEGITVSDFIWGLRDAAASLNAGLDLEEPLRQQRAEHLPAQLEAGETSWAAVERAGLHLLAAQLRSYAAREAAEPGAEVMASDEHRALAREVGARAMVLLKNDAVGDAPVLPLDPAAVQRIAVVGRLAVHAGTGDRGSSLVHAPSHVSPVDGIRAAFPDAEITLVESDDPAAAAEAARNADVALLVVGFDETDEGEYIGGDTMSDPTLTALYPPVAEGVSAPDLGGTVMTDGMGGDRTSLRLRPSDEELIHAVAAANPRTVVSVVAAGAVVCEAWRHDVPAVLMMWYAGMEGGHALADVLTGAQNPSGRLPYSIPTSEDHLPAFDKDARAITYDRWHGQRLLDRLGVPAAYPHGFGLSYTTFRLDGVEVQEAGGVPVVRASVTNTGARDGHHVVQVYGRRTDGLRDGETLLVGFAAVEVAAGTTAEVAVPVTLAALGAWNPRTTALEPPTAADVVLEVGAHAHDPQAHVVPATS
ncbi:glycoside hydrolase family 3 protein [Kineococcus rubinsiae]|uniref:glycoside hydrolase family 3 protein n=1 Tax=Kineococcus rubinsiae TaxID=2609562 RepID=UPI001430B64B|nr:glycoside hydrolase family 3 C-terminal domain-containing protein [Kineococcus rubinsiae]NIZ92842.1 family 3 glycosyl hydrolase [Kineococcus rubinsiae]